MTEINTSSGDTEVMDQTIGTEGAPKQDRGQPVLEVESRRQKATGPRTKRGKAVSRRNAIKYGFFAKHVPIQTAFFKESKAEFKHLVRALKEDWKPVGITEELQVELAAIHLWQFRRLLRVEEVLLFKANLPPTHDLYYLYELEENRLLAEKENEAGQEKEPESHNEENNLLDEIEERVARNWPEQVRHADFLKREHQHLEELQIELPPPDKQDWLQKCKDQILRNYYRALSELERLQRMRLGDKVPPRFVMEVHQD